MKHESPHPLGESPSSGGIPTETASTPIDLRDNAYWNEVLLADFVEQDNQEEWPDQPSEDSSEYAVLSFVS